MKLTLNSIFSIIIIIILFVAVFFSWRDAFYRYRDGLRVEDIKRISLANAIYYSHYGYYAKSISLLIEEKLLEEEPKDPKTKISYYYAYMPKNQPSDYHLGAVLEKCSSDILDIDSDYNSTEGFWYGYPFNGIDPENKLSFRKQICIYDIRVE